jgi:hypothetical protein
MPKRFGDGRHLYRQHREHCRRDVWVWLTFVGADCYGLQPWRPLAVAEETGWPKARVEAALEELILDSHVLRYECSGDTYLAFPRWQDDQTITHYGTPTCAPVPPEIFQKFSAKTQELFRKAAGKFQPSLLLLTDDCLLLTTLKGTAPAEGVLSPAEINAARGAAIARYLARLREKTHAANPVFSTGHAAKFFTTRLTGDKHDDPRDLINAVDYFFDEYITSAKSSWKFATFTGAYNHVLSVLIERQKA